MSADNYTSRLVDMFQWDGQELQEFLSWRRITQIVAVSGTAVLTIIWLRKRRRQQKNYPPGYPALPIVGSIPFMKYTPKDPHLEFEKCFEKYGNVYSAWLGNVFTVNIGGYETIREALVNQSVAFAGRPNELMPMATLVNPQVTGIIDRSYCPAWKRDRNMALSILREFGFGKNLMEPRILDEVQSLISFLKGLNGKPYDPRATLTTSVSNVICAIILGRRYPLDDCAELQSVIRDMDFLFQGALKLTPLFFLPILRHVPYFKRILQELEESQDRVKKYLRDIIQEHKDSYSAGKEDDFIDAFLGQVGKEANNDEDLTFLLRDLLIGGSETTATTLEWAMLYMANYPDIQTKVQKEIEKEVGKDRTVTLQDKNRLPYTEAVLQEIQRISVLVPLTPGHLTLSDVKLEGYDIPKHTMVMVSLWSVLRDPKLWPEPDKFIPERFLNGHGQVVHKAELINFSLGRRSCLGELMARQELFLFFCGLLQNFTFKAPDGVSKFDEEGTTFITRSPVPFDIIAEPRS